MGSLFSLPLKNAAHIYRIHTPVQYTGEQGDIYDPTQTAVDGGRHTHLYF